MLDHIAEVGAGFDWITPLITIIQDFMCGPVHRFAVPFGAGWSGKDVARLLEANGVTSWGYMVCYDNISLRVPLKQARTAQYVMLSEGIPIAEGVLRGPAPVTTARVAGHGVREHRRSRSRRGMLQQVLEMLGL